MVGADMEKDCGAFERHRGLLSLAHHSNKHLGVQEVPHKPPQGSPKCKDSEDNDCNSLPICDWETRSGL